MGVEADGLIADHEAEVFEPQDGLEVQAETGAVPDGIEAVLVLDVSFDDVVGITDKADSGRHIRAGGQAAVEAVGVAEGEGEHEICQMGFGAGVFGGFVDFAGGLAAEDHAFLQVTEVYLEVQQAQGQDVAAGNAILAFHYAEIQAQAAAGHPFRNAANQVVSDSHPGRYVPGRIFEFIVIIRRLGEGGEAQAGQNGQSE